MLKDVIFNIKSPAFTLCTNKKQAISVLF